MVYSINYTAITYVALLSEYISTYVYTMYNMYKEGDYLE